MSPIFAINIFRDVLDFSVATSFQVNNLNFFCMELVKQQFPAFWGKKIWESNSESEYLAQGQQTR